MIRRSHRNSSIFSTYRTASKHLPTWLSVCVCVTGACHFKYLRTHPSYFKYLEVSIYLSTYLPTWRVLPYLPTWRVLMLFKYLPTYKNGGR